MRINREQLNKAIQLGQTHINRVGVELNDWRKLGQLWLGLSEKLGSLQEAILLSTQLQTERGQALALRQVGQLNGPAQIDQLCAVWYDTRAPMLGNLIAQKAWVASAPLAVKVLSSLQAGQATKLDKTQATILGELIRVGQVETDLQLAQIAVDQLSEVQDQAGLEALLAHWTQQDIPPLFTVEEVVPLATAYTAGFKVWVVLKLGRLELLAEGGPEIIEPLLAVYSGKDQLVAEAARQVLLHLDNSAAREKLCELALQVDQLATRIRPLVMQAGYYPQELHQRALFFFLTGQWEKYESLDFDFSLLKLNYETATEEVRYQIKEAARLNGRAEIATMLVSSGRNGLNWQRLRTMRHDEWLLVVRLLIRGKRWEEAFALVKIAPAVYSGQILKKLVEVNWQPAGPEMSKAFAELSAKAVDCAYAYPPLGRQLNLEGQFNLSLAGVETFAISLDGKKLATVERKGTITLWSLPDGKLIKVLDEVLYQADEQNKVASIKLWINKLVFSPDGQSLAYMQQNWLKNGKVTNQWRLWKTVGGVVSRPLEQNQMGIEICNAVFSPNSRLIAIYTINGIKIREVDTGKLLAELPTSDAYNLKVDNVHSLSFRYDGKWLAIGLKKSRFGPKQAIAGLIIWEIWEKKVRYQIFDPDPEGKINVLKVGYSEPKALIMDQHFNIFVWDMPRSLLFPIQSRRQHEVGSVAVSSDGQRIAVGHRGAIRLRNPAKYQLVKTVARLGQELITELIFSSDGQYLVCSTSTGKVMTWSTRLAKLAHTHIEQIAPDDLQFVQKAQKDPALPDEERHWLRFVESLLGWQLRQLLESGETLSGQNWLTSIESLLGWQLLYEIELEKAPTVEAGDFDIEIDSI